jgi:catechol 2,3-dioxygenase-like lactoylglutathione lyase family enzyme
MSPNPSASDVKVFLPTLDFDESLRFYEALGWKTNWRHEGLAEIELANVRLYLQKFYVEEFANNLMIHIAVDDAAAWHQHVADAIEKGGFEKARVQKPKEEPYGALVTYAWDPSGVLLHFAQTLSAKDGE